MGTSASSIEIVKKFVFTSTAGGLHARIQGRGWWLIGNPWHPGQIRLGT